MARLRQPLQLLDRIRFLFAQQNYALCYSRCQAKNVVAYLRDIKWEALGSNRVSIPGRHVPVNRSGTCRWIFRRGFHRQ